ADSGGPRCTVAPPAPLLRLPAADILDHQTAHRSAGVGQEPRPVREPDAFLVRDVEVGLMQEVCGAEGEVRATPPQLTLGDSVQLAIEGGEQLVRRRSIACIRGLDELGDRRVHGSRRSAATQSKSGFEAEHTTRQSRRQSCRPYLENVGHASSTVSSIISDIGCCRPMPTTPPGLTFHKCKAPRETRGASSCYCPRM